MEAEGGKPAAHPREKVRTPRRAWILLAVVVALFVTVSAWNIGGAGYSGFYSSAARSMSVSWRALLFGAFDPTASITLDKLAGFVVPQALSARLFGFSAWSIALPQVVEGAVTVVAVFAIGRRWHGPGAGLVAAAAFATMPLMTSMFGHVMEDGLLTMSLALAVVSWQRAVAEPGDGSRRRILPLLFAAGWVGVGFQAKMLQAWFVVPALVLGLLLVGVWSWRARLARAAVFVAATVLASLSWMIVVQLIPRGSRPFIDGTTNDDVFSMVFGYNGLGRFADGLVPGAVRQFVGASIGAHQAGLSPFKLLLPVFTTQVGWIYPLAVAGIVLALRGRSRPPAAARPAAAPTAAVPTAAASTAAALTAWLATAAVLLSVTTVPHTAYVAALAVPVSVLAGAGLVEAHRLGGRVLAVVVAVEIAWVLSILQASRIAPEWLSITVAVAGVLGCALLVVGRAGGAATRGRAPRSRSARRSNPRPAARLGLAAALVAIFVAPAAWTASTVDLPLSGSANDAYGGPRLERVGYFFQTSGTLAERTTFDRFTVRPPVLTAPAPALTIEQRHLVDFTRRHVRAGSLLFTAGSWSLASPYILTSALSVGSLGGFSGVTPSPTVAQVKRDVGTGARRYFLLPTQLPSARQGHPTEARRVESWVTATCTFVPDDVYEAATTLPGQTLWDCRV